ncbi:MAG: hypothetical protein ACJAYU_001183 [Bradymonadia bacterium]|jgi:hypothetical protein
MVARHTVYFALVAASLAAPTRLNAQSPAEGSGTPAVELPGPDVVEAAPLPDLSEVSVELELPDPFETALGLPIEVGVRLTVPSHLELATLTVGGNRYIELHGATQEPLVGGQALRTIELAVFRTGDFQSSGVEVVLIDDAGRQHRVSSAPFTLTVLSRIINETNPVAAPSDPPLVVLTRDMRPVYAGSALGFLGLGVLIAALWRRRKEPEHLVEIPPELRRPAWEIAAEQLAALEGKGMLDDGRHLDFHMRLSEIVREYIGRRFSFLALEMTTTEIARALDNKDAGEYREELLEVLGDMDLVKFAKFTPSRELSNSSFESVRSLIEELSARERQQAADGSAVADLSLSGADVALEPDSDPHAPSPESTTSAFLPHGSDGLAESGDAENVVSFPGESSRSPSEPAEDNPVEPPDPELSRSTEIALGEEISLEDAARALQNSDETKGEGE